MDDEKMKFFIVNNAGENVECEVLFTFDSEETQKSYVVYTDNTMDDDGNTIIYASTYNPDSEDMSLQPVETDKEWKIINNILETLQMELVEKIKNTEIWISEMENKIDSMNESEEANLELCISQIVDKLMDEVLETCTEPLFQLLKKVQKKAKHYESNAQLVIKAYLQTFYLLAEQAFYDAGANNCLAYIIRRYEVKDASKYSLKTIAELLKAGVHKKEPFSMINMALLWALSIGGDEAWRLADSIMSNIPVSNISTAADWWLELGWRDDIEGYLVHYWLLKYAKIKCSLLGNRIDIRRRIHFSIKNMPMYI